MTARGGVDRGGAGPAQVVEDAAGTEVGVRIRTHPSLCLGWGNCHRWAPEVYPLDEHGEIAVQRLQVPPELALRAWYGASACPERAITVIGPPEHHWAALARRGRPDELSSDVVGRSPVHEDRDGGGA